MVIQMDTKFRLGGTIYFVIAFVFIIGLLLGVINSNFMLKFLPNEASLGLNDNGANITRLPEETLKNLEKEKYLIIYNENNPYSVELMDNINQTLEYMKKEVTLSSLSEIPSSFNDFHNVIVALEEVSEISNLRTLETYTAEGGHVFFAIRPEINGSLQNLYRKLGIYEVGEFIIPNGMKLTSNVLIKQNQLVMEKGETGDNSSLSIGIDDRSTVYIESIDQVPLLWDIPYEKGKFMVFNGTMLGWKENRGLIAGAISLLNENFIYPIMNMKIAYIDDFPAPIPEGKNEKIYEEYRRDIPSFYQDIWWPDILKTSAKYDVKYTGAVIQNYGDKVTPPFDITEQDRNTFIQFGRELLKMGGEIGVHGYNHQSLTVNQEAVDDLGYNAWNNQADMEEALNKTVSYVKDIFSNYDFTTYVPPSNRIDEVGEAALKQAIPSVNVLSSLYLPDGSPYTTVHEFDRSNEFIHIPRITAGYEYTDKTKWALVNGITSIGVFSHFIHPDDILDEERSSGKKWSLLEEEYDHLLSDTYEDYPWLKSMTARGAGQQLTNYLNADVYIKEESNRIVVQIDKFPGEMSFILRTKKNIGKLKDCTVQKVDEDVYYVKTKKATIELGLVD
ncbi:DUF2194 domain-containing protein [Lysinibacillus telephonicus]|uniref:DUF2194 domain-containing protein n=2 Tax=Lysinibacillus telephonicus TaxID=1714840 RepID=A0A3S0HP91_9BACI|nr:DUF2194 domain-containing protein [Lysinibacillus telephonicus]